MNNSADRTTRKGPEAAIRAACDAGQHDEALKILLEAYAEELLSFLNARLCDPSHADEAFSLLAEDLWQSLPKFEFRSSARTWAYTLARHTAARYARAYRRHRVRNLTLSKNVPLSQLVEHVRSRTQMHLRTDIKSQVRSSARAARSG